MESIYSGYSPEEYQELFSNFLVDSWSYSKVSGFARNEKAFEMQYIFGLYSRSSATTIAGQAYHNALQYYFTKKKEGIVIDLVEMEMSAFAFIEDIPANRWKIQKTTPTIEACQKKAVSTVTALLKNFYTEKGVYEDDISEIIDVELKFEEFLTVNGVDIPLPCHAIIDLVVRTHNGSIAVVDHKSRTSFTADEEIALSIGIQAITYTLCYEAKTGQSVNEVWFVENKPSQNKDKGPQLNKFPVIIDSNTRKLYEALLYEPLKRMIEAVSSPDYVYLINESDNFVDKAELYDFWARTMICEVEDFNVDEAKKELVSKRLRKIRDASIATISPSIIRRFKENADKFIQYDLSDKNMTQEEKIEHVLRSFSILARCAHTFEGYSSNTYLLEVSAGVKVASIYSYKLDIANALNVPTVRFSRDMVIHDGKSYLSVEFAKKREKDLLFNPNDLDGFKIPIGKDNYNNTVVWDLDNHSTPHALICGATGSGKSVCVRSIIEYAKLAGIKKIIILDPKYEFMNYKGKGIEVVNEISAIEETMKHQVQYMEELVKTGRHEKAMIVFDEFADAVLNARSGNDLKIYEHVQVGMYANGNVKTQRQHVDTDRSLEENLRLLLQKGRSCGIRVVAATQRASVKVITGDAKVNFPVQICFRVPKATDSQVVLDEPGAEGLAGMGDGLIKSPQYNDIIRFQAYLNPNS
jgi:DNA segregation ATPase FtsK/SpoIIIE, S-DNA-T family